MTIYELHRGQRRIAATQDQNAAESIRRRIYRRARRQRVRPERIIIRARDVPDVDGWPVDGCSRPFQHERTGG